MRQSVSQGQQFCQNFRLYLVGLLKQLLSRAVIDMTNFAFSFPGSSVCFTSSDWLNFLRRSFTELAGGLAA